MMIELLRQDEAGLVLHAPTLDDMERCNAAGGVLVADYWQPDPASDEYQLAAGDFRFAPVLLDQARALLPGGGPLDLKAS